MCCFTTVCLAGLFGVGCFYLCFLCVFGVWFFVLCSLKLSRAGSSMGVLGFCGAYSMKSRWFIRVIRVFLFLAGSFICCTVWLLLVFW